jgi:hypothetical protein
MIDASLGLIVIDCNEGACGEVAVSEVEAVLD